MKQLAAMSATGFEQACADLLSRDGFRGARRVGGAGDLGVDVTARDGEDRLLILQCKQYQNTVGSGHVQKFNGTARLHHGADVPIMIALNGFTQPAIDFAQHHQLILMGRPELKKWAHGQHLYDVLGIQSTTRPQLGTHPATGPVRTPHQQPSCRPCPADARTSSSGGFRAQSMRGSTRGAGLPYNESLPGGRSMPMQHAVRLGHQHRQ